MSINIFLMHAIVSMHILHRKGQQNNFLIENNRWVKNNRLIPTFQPVLLF